MQLLQGELSGMLGKVQLAKTALSSAQHQVLPPLHTTLSSIFLHSSAHTWVHACQGCVMVADQVAHWKRKAERLEQAAEAQAEAAVVEKENERCARSHAEQAVTWVCHNCSMNP